MAEAITAIGVAASIVQFIDVGARVASKASEIHKRGGSAPAELGDMQKSCEGMRRIFKDIQDTESSDAVGSTNGQYFQGLATDCVDLAAEIEQLVAEIGAAHHRSKRTALKIAVKTMRREERIRPVRARLQKLHQELVLHLLDLIR